MTPLSDIPPNRLKLTASDFPVTTAAEVATDAELDILAAATLVFGAEVVALDIADAVLVLMLVLMLVLALVPVPVLAAVTLGVDVAVVLVVSAISVLEGAALDTLVLDCTVLDVAPIWQGDGKH